MLGDEVLLAPVVEAGEHRKVELPRGNWTDFRTNTEYQRQSDHRQWMRRRDGCRRSCATDGLFRWLKKIRWSCTIFRHWAAEFFLWEPELEENSQFHAAPAGDFLRVEVESKRRRTYEWVIHHTKAPREVEDSGASATCRSLGR